MFFLKFACGLGFAGTVFIRLLPPGGRLNYEAYNVDTKSQSLKTLKRKNTKMKLKIINNKKQPIKDHSNSTFNKHV